MRFGHCLYLPIVRRLYRWLWLPSLPALLFQSIHPYLLILLPRFSSLMGIRSSSSFSIKICFFFLKLRFCVSVFIFTYMGLFSWTDVLGFVSLFCLWCNYIFLLLPRLIGIPLPSIYVLYSISVPLLWVLKLKPKDAVFYPYVM